MTNQASYLKTTVSVVALLGLVACARSETKVLEPYTLANGHTYQDVVTVGANGKGTAPVVTQINTYAVDPTGKHGGEAHLVSSNAAGGEPLINAVAGGLATGIVSGAVAAALDDDTVASAPGTCPLGTVGVPPNCTPVGASDRRLKRNVAFLGRNSDGIAIYSFRYKNDMAATAHLDSSQFYIGVMAQDLVHSHPEAVVMGSNGYYAVRYDLIGVKFVTVGAYVSDIVRRVAGFAGPAQPAWKGVLASA